MSIRKIGYSVHPNIHEIERFDVDAISLLMKCIYSNKWMKPFLCLEQYHLPHFNINASHLSHKTVVVNQFALNSVLVEQKGILSLIDC